MRSQAAGHDTKLYIRRYDRQKRPIGRGLCDLVSDFHGWLRWADLILLEGNAVYMTEADRWRVNGMTVIGGGVESASLAVLEERKAQRAALVWCKDHQQLPAALASLGS
jgi:hypothetical protein